jgi:outer membrane receptor protein involved in Fe transport
MPRSPRSPAARPLRAPLLATAVAAAAFLTLPTVRAQGADAEIELESLLNTQVEGASRFLENTLDAPAAVNVIGRDTSAALGHETVADMLQRLPGTYVTTSRNYGGLGFRGFNRPGDYNARILMAIDGYRVNDALYDQALPGHEFPIVADWVKRLELINGPASSVYGGNALLGVANVVTADGADLPGLGLRAAIERADTQRWTGQYGWASGGTDVFIGLTHQRDGGETLRLPELAGEALPGGVVAGLDDQRYSAMLAKVRRGPWRATVVAHARDKESPTAEYGSVPGAEGSGYKDRYSYAELAYDGPWQHEWRLQARANAARTMFQGDYVLPAEDGSLYTNRDVGEARWVGVEARLQWRGWLNHAVSAGVEMRRVLKGSQRNQDLGDEPAVYLDRDDRTMQAGVYVQDQVRLSERTSVTLGMRADDVDGFALEFSPRLALVHRPGPQEAVKLMLGRAFRTPNLSERFYDDGGATQVANPGLRPERIASIELAWERALDNATRLGVSAYSYQLNNLIELVGVDEEISRYENVSKAQVHGIDVDLERRAASGWQWRTSLSLSSMSGSDGARPVNSPRWLAKGHVLAPWGDDWSAGLQWLAMAPREGLRARVPSLLTADALLRRELTPGHSLALVVRNLADAQAYDPASSENDLLRVPRAGRSVALEWRGRF